MNIHVHTVDLDYASRVLKCLASAGRSGSFPGRTFIGAGLERRYQYEDDAGTVQVQIFRRLSGTGSGFLKKLLATLIWNRRVEVYARGLPAKCINVHGLSTLALGVALKRRHHCALIYDTHELESRAAAVRGVRRLYSERLERALIPSCDAVICVSDGIADWFAAHYGIRRPLVMRNVPDLRLQAAPKMGENLRVSCGVPPNALLFLYQGRLITGRQVEHFLEVFRRLSPDRHVVFMGNGELEEIVRRAAANHPNIHYHPAVPPNQVLSYVAQADVGLVGVENKCLSYYLSLPNKLFECLAAGVPTVVPDFPEMRRLVDQYRCGWAWAGKTTELAAFLGRLTIEEVKAKRERALAVGSELTWEREEQKLLDLYRKVLRPQPTPVLP